jgi:iron complex transport system ATP-binding protein
MANCSKEKYTVMEQKQTILSTHKLSIGYATKRGVHTVASNLNLSLDSSRLISLVGANGIGKSTLLRTLTGIQKPLEGTVHLGNKMVSQYEALELAQNLSLVLTEKLPPSNLTVFELIALGRQPYTNWLGTLTEEDSLKINEAIALTQIGHLVDQKHYEISDGQLQIVLIARALAQDTPLIILDEPTTHLDLFHKVSVFKLLKKLSQETRKCILFSTHDIELAIQLSDEMIVMTEEQVVLDQPCNLISQGVFDTLFNDASITFDGTKGTFIIK